jgi:hypothetical protein
MSRASNISYLPSAAAAAEIVSSSDQPKRRLVFREGAKLPARSEEIVDERLGEELETFHRWIANIAGSLAVDPIIRNRYAFELKNLERVSSEIGQVGSIVAAADKAQAIERLTAPELKARLQRKAIAPMFEAKH